MKKFLKWALLAVALLIVAAGMFGLGFVSRTRMAAPVAIQRNMPALPQRNGPMMGERGRMFFPQARPMPRMGWFGHGPFMPGMMAFGFFGRLIPLALLLLLLYVVYRVGKGHGTPAPVAVAVAPPAVPPPDPVIPTHLCPSCNQAVQNDWKHCPNCGEKQPE